MANSTKKKKRKLRPWALAVVIIIGFAVISLILALIVALAPDKKEKETAQAQAEETQALIKKADEEEKETEEELESTDETETPDAAQADDSAFTDTNSLLVVANKKHPLPSGYVPADLVEPNVTTLYGSAPMRQEAAEALERMFAAAQNDGVYLILGSAYRSEGYQSELYYGYVSQYGRDEADTISARPGYSDHQTGLAADISDNAVETYLTQAMENSAEGIWLRDHAHEYGFIMRYPKGKDEITGYAYEPWHFRYIGVDYATAIYDIDEFYSFEEYFGVEGGDYVD